MRIDSIGIDEMTNEVVRKFLPKGTKDKVLIFNLILEAYNYNGKDSTWQGSCYNLQIGFYAPNNYIKVGYRLNENDPFTHVADHDSCWREGAKRAVDATINKMDKEIEEKGLQDEDLLIDARFDFTGIQMLKNKAFRFEEKNGHYDGFYHIIDLE